MSKMKHTLKNKKVLVTCGPTWVPLDSVRVISNLSTGTLGQNIARDFQKSGAKVTLIEGPVAKPLTAKSLRVLKFRYFHELSVLLKNELGKKYDICIHAAAVADYKLKRPGKTKWRSHCKSLRLELVPTKKIIQQIRRSAPDLFLVGFKLEPGINKTKAVAKTRGVFKDGKCDLVVANSVDNGKYESYILDREGTFFAHERSRKKLSRSLVRTVSSKI